MIPQSWDDVAGAVTIFTLGFTWARKCWQERHSIGNAVVSAMQAVCFWTLDKVRRDWQTFSGMPRLARVFIGTLFLNLAVALAWDIAARPVPPLLTVHLTAGMIGLALYAAYLGAMWAGRRVKRLSWQR